MKKILMVFLVVCLVSLPSCSNTKRIDGKLYETYGLFNKDEVRNPDVEYHLVIGNVIWGIILVETIIAPIYFFGFDLYEPIRAR